MNPQHRDVLTKVLVDFMREIKHLDVVVNSLKKDGVLNDIDYDNILKQPSRSPGDKVRELLETLSKSGPQAFGSFVKALNLHQKWLATRLQTELVLSNAHVKEIFKSNSKDVRIIVSDLFARDVLSDQNKKEILQHQAKKFQVEELLRILPSTRPEALAIFTDVLISRKQTKLVSVLQDKRGKVERSLAGSHFISSDTTQLEEELVNTKQELQAKKDETKGLKEDIKKLQEENEREKLENKILKSDYELLDTDLCCELKNLQDRISSLEKQLNELKKARENESAAHEKLKNDYEMLKTTNCSKMNELQDRIAFLEDALDELEEERENESTGDQKIENYNEMLQDLADNISSQVKHLEEVKEAWNVDGTTAHEQLKDCRKRLEIIHLSQMDILQDKNSCLAKELEEVKEALRYETTTNEELKCYRNRLETIHLRQMDIVRDKNSCLVKELEKVKEAWKNESAASRLINSDYEKLQNDYKELATGH